MESESRILIRCAMQSFDDVNVICPHDWNVRRLKEHLRDVCQQKPDPNRQRLIFAGQCLDDNATLGPVLTRHSDSSTVPVFHLVCPPTEAMRVEQENSLLRRRRIQTEAAQNANSTAIPTMSDPMYPNFFTQFNPQPIPGQPMTPPVDWQQQMYQAYMANYAQYMQQVMSTINGSPAFGNNIFPASAFIPGAPPPSPASAPVAPDPVVNDPPVAAAGAEAPAMNAQGGLMAEDDDLREQDWLDLIYSGIRAALLATVIYFYSSPDRLMAAAVFIFALWTLRGGWNNVRGIFRQMRRRQLSNRQRNQVNNGSDEANSESTERIVEVIEPAQMSAWTLFWSTCYTFVTSFFASLIPEVPPPLNMN